MISSTDQKAAVQNISSKDKDSSIGNDIKLLTTQCVEDLCANQSSKVEGPQQSIHGPLSEASLDKVDTGAATEDFFRTLLANLEDELAASQKDRYSPCHPFQSRRTNQSHQGSLAQPPLQSQRAAPKNPFQSKGISSTRLYQSYQQPPTQCLKSHQAVLKQLHSQGMSSKQIHRSHQVSL